MTELVAAGRYCTLGDLFGPTLSGRDRFDQLLQSSKPSWGRAMRKISDSRASPHAAKPKTASSLHKADIFCAMGRNRILRGIVELLGPRQGAVNLVSAAARETRTADLPYIPFLEPQLHAAPLEPMDPPHRRAAAAARAKGTTSFGIALLLVRIFWAEAARLQR